MTTKKRQRAASKSKTTCMDISAADLYIALGQSLKLQAHYAELLNFYEGGERDVHVFSSPEVWIARLREIGDLHT